jgi:hypothetical protein
MNMRWRVISCAVLFSFSQPFVLPGFCCSPNLARSRRIRRTPGCAGGRPVAYPPSGVAQCRERRQANGEWLTIAGFEVTAAPDLAQNEMRQTFSDFAAKVAASGPDTIALVFYAGHGIADRWRELSGADRCRSETRSDIPLQAVRLNDLLNTLGALPTRMRIIMLDACRNNPFPST